jgi:hypothetical protein
MIARSWFFKEVERFCFESLKWTGRKAWQLASIGQFGSKHRTEEDLRRS